MPFDPPTSAVLIWLLIPLFCIASIVVLISYSRKQQLTQVPDVNKRRSKVGSIVLFAFLCLLASPFLMIIVGGKVLIALVTIMFIALLTSFRAPRR